MPDPDAVDQLTAVAFRKLADGAAPGEVFAQVAGDDVDPRDAAMAVCLAVGVP